MMVSYRAGEVEAVLIHLDAVSAFRSDQMAEFGKIYYEGTCSSE